jgi:hypothetical protein
MIRVPRANAGRLRSGEVVQIFFVIRALAAALAFLMRVGQSVHAQEPARRVLLLYPYDNHLDCRHGYQEAAGRRIFIEDCGVPRRTACFGRSSLCSRFSGRSSCSSVWRNMIFIFESGRVKRDEKRKRM